MSTPQDQTAPSTATVVEQTVIATAEKLIPVILAGISAGTTSANPYAATIAALAPIIVQLIQMQGAGASELAQIMNAMTTSIANTQAQIDAAAKARGVTDTTA